MPNHRDSSIEALLRARRASAASPDEPCLDGETLAAWMDGALPPAARTAAERHAASCTRCQTLVAAMARTMPSVDARPQRGSWRARWLLPSAAIAAAVVVWIAVDRQTHEIPSAVPPARTEPAAAAVAAGGTSAPADLAKTAPTQDALRRVEAPPATPATPRRHSATPETKSPEPPSSGADRQAMVAAAPPRTGAVGGALDSIRPLPQTRADNVASSPPPAVPPSPTSPSAAPRAVAEAKPGDQVTAAPQPLKETVSVQSDSSVLADNRRVGAIAGRPAFTTAGLEIMSPDPKFRWRLAGPSTIERSTDGGLNWTPHLLRATPLAFASQELAGVEMSWTAGASPAPDVCWIVGRRGLVLLTTDGTTWQIRRVPQAVDLTAVRASDAKSAVVTAADGREFTTSDGGSTWRAGRARAPAERD